MNTTLWNIVASILSWSPFVRFILWAATKEPDRSIEAADGSTYMRRWWLFNRIDDQGCRRYPAVPFSLRVHHILREDRDRHLHDHPWAFRTFVLRGGYVETKMTQETRTLLDPAYRQSWVEMRPSVKRWMLWRHSMERLPGTSSEFKLGEFHKIESLLDPKRGALTLVALGTGQQTWGFWVSGRKVPARTYLSRK